MPISKASNAVQAAAYARLAADTALVALVDRIGDSVPEGIAAREYVVLAAIAEARDRRLLTGAGGNAARVLLSVSTHVEDTQDRTGWKTAQAISQRVVELLDSATLTITGWTFVSCDYVDSTAQQDGPWRSVIDDFAIYVEDT